jgi:hypothetical protein
VADGVTKARLRIAAIIRDFNITSRHAEGKTISAVTRHGSGDLRLI